MSHYQHETAIVDPGAVIGDGTRVWHFVHVCGGAVIGGGVFAGPECVCRQPGDHRQ